MPDGRTAPLDYVTIYSDPPLTEQEESHYLSASSKSRLQRWMLVEPLPRDAYTTEVRISDLVRRMLAAKLHGAKAVFIPDPFQADRGLLEPGMMADIVCFDAETVRDLATYEDPMRPPAGIVHVFVNGTLAVRDGRSTGARAGRAVRSSTYIANPST